jgi:hypothetical protein
MENRKLSRVNFQIEAEFSFEGNNYKAQVKNLSLKGALIEIPEKNDIELEDQLEIKLIINGMSTNLEISLNAIVIRKENNNLGLKFGIIDIESFIHLRNIIAYNSGDYDMVMEEFLKNHN